VTEASAKKDPLLGQLVSNRYRIIRAIGEGGMGIVYEAMHEAIEKRIALKVLHAQYSASPEVLHRFKQEAISASRIKHQNVIDVFDYGQLEDGSCFIAMEYLQGMDLGQALANRGHFSPPSAIRITLQICSALGLGHGRGVVHRDLKPENIFLQMTPEGEEVVKIVDFGIAQLREDKSEPVQEGVRARRVTKIGMIFGTPEYMAPEQARGQLIDQRSDIYAAGVILYELLTGGVPFLGENLLEVLNQHVQSIVPPVGQVNPVVHLSPALEEVVHKALEKDPNLRYATMIEFSNAMSRTPEGCNARDRQSLPLLVVQDSVEEFRSERSNLLPSNPLGSSPLASAPEPPTISDVTATRKGGGGTPLLGTAAPVVSGQTFAKVESVGTKGGQTPQSSLKALTWGAVGTLFVVLGVGGSLYLQSVGSSWGSLVSQKVSKTTVASPVFTKKVSQEGDFGQGKSERPAQAVVQDELVPSPAPPPVKGDVVLHIVTAPSGGIVRKDGFQVCDAAPCDLTVQFNEAVILTAQKANMKGEAKVLAQKDQNVAIQLFAPRPTRKRKRKKTASAPSRLSSPAPAAKPPALCEVMVDGIKILRPCK